MKNLILLLVITLGLNNFSNAQTKEIEPKGIYKEIDIARHNKTIELLNDKDEKVKQQAVDSVLKNPNFYNPPVIYALSRELFNQNKKDDAMFWFYVAQLRARYDANLCMDNSAKQAVSIFNQEYGPEINMYAFQDLKKLEKTVTKVVDFVRSNNEDYDHRWLNLHGMWAILAGQSEEPETKELSKPKEEWAAIKKKTIDDYYKGFIEHVKNEKK